MDKDIIDTLQRLMYAYNPYAQILKTVGERVRDDNSSILGLKLICRRGADARRYNRPTVDEVAAILPSGSMDAPEDRDIVVQLRNDKLRRVSALHPAYFPLSYPLLFIRGEDGFSTDLSLTNPRTPTGPLQHAVFNPALPAPTPAPTPAPAPALAPTSQYYTNQPLSAHNAIGFGVDNLCIVHTI
ncbi:hypothetical protein F5H01DRAFT_400941 [Linnemannia elongata]|nr:hypothetical protein F5H01DRAFT_400941 [Linnemannia elongata]